jgi:hypothetical protein
MQKKKVALALAAIGLGLFALTGCSTQAQVASKNLSVAADQFEINRRVVFFNGITDKYLLEIDGFCSVETSASLLTGALEVTCKTGPNAYKKHFLGLSNNVSYFVEQIDSANVSAYRYRVIFRPETIIPDLQLNTSIGK